MWYDFVFKFEQLFEEFAKGRVEFWSLFNSTVVGTLLIGLFTIFALIIMLINGLASNDIKFYKCKKRIDKFFSAYGVLKKENLLAFKNYCISSMPRKAKKSFATFATNPTMQTQSLFKKEMQKATMESGVAGFVTYMVIFVFGIILSVAVSVAETFFFNGENLWLAISLFYGALLLIAMAVQMYLIGNKNASTIDEIYIQIASRSMLICDKKCRAEQNKKDVLATRKDEQIEKTSSVINKEKPIDSIDELRILVASLIERGASKELLDFLKNSLKSVAQTEYASYVDNLRIKNIIQKLEDYCVSGLKSC